MSSSKSATAPDLKLKPSRLLRIYLILIVVLTLFALWMLSVILWPIQLGLSLAVLFMAYRSWQQHENVVAVKHKGDVRWLLFLKDGTKCKVELLNNYYVMPWLVVMNFISLQGVKYSVVVLSDRVGGECLRGLRVYLRQLRM